jgi:hypothetical protein
MNLFPVGKGTQIATWAGAGGVGLAGFDRDRAVRARRAAALFVGHRIHDRVSAATYARWLRGFLWLMVGLLVLQLRDSNGR